ncbi:MAG: glycosyltransferase family 39 protein [Thermomicrobiales bacterium]
MSRLARTPRRSPRRFSDPTHRPWVDLALATFLAAVTFWHLLPATRTTPFHRDEARWVHRASYLALWADPLGPLWQDEGYEVRFDSFDERYRMRAQPPVAPYVFGLGLLLQGRDVATNGYYIMDRDEAWNEARGNLPGSDDLLAARRANVGVGVVMVVAVFAMARRLAGRVAGVTGGLLLAFHPLLLDTTTRVWSDPTMVALVALAGVAAYRLADRPTWPRAVALGILLGLGAGAKLSPLAIAAGLGGVGVVVLAHAAWRGRTPRSIRPGRGTGRQARLGWWLVSVPPVAWLTMVATFPYLWTDPIGHTRALFTFRAQSFELQMRAFDRAAVETRGEAFDRVWRQLTEWMTTGGVLDARLRDWTGTGWANLRYLDVSLAALGLVAVLVIIRREGPFGPAALVVATVGGEALLVFLAMDVDYARYHLPILLALAVSAGLGAGMVWGGVVALVSGAGRRRPRPTGMGSLGPISGG